MAAAHIAAAINSINAASGRKSTKPPELPVRVNGITAKKAAGTTNKIYFTKFRFAFAQIKYSAAASKTTARTVITTRV